MRSLVMAVALAAVQQPGPPTTVEQVDLARYMGTYYEVARFPNRFQQQCAGDVSATYSLRPDGRVDVVNRCRLADGSMEEARGVARRAGKDAGNARLEVRFAPAFLSLLPQVWGDYWILGLGPDYGYSVVGSPDRQYLWILSRTPEMPETAYRQALAIAASNGYDVSRLERTPQRPAASADPPGA